MGGKRVGIWVFIAWKSTTTRLASMLIIVDSLAILDTIYAPQT